MSPRSKEDRFDDEVYTPAVAAKKLPTVAEMQAKAAEASRNAWKNAGDAPASVATDVRDVPVRLDAIPKISDLRDAYLARVKNAWREPCDHPSMPKVPR